MEPNTTITSSEQIPKMRTMQYIMNLTGLSRVTLYRDMDANILVKPTKIRSRNYWHDYQVVEYFNRIAKTNYTLAE